MRENRISVFRKHTLGILVALGMVLFGSVFILFTNIGKNKATVAAEETLQFIKEQSSRSEAFAEFYQGLHLEMNGIIMICKNGLVTGSNFEEYQGKTQAEAPLIQNITEETEPDTLFSFRYYGSAYFGVFESYGENDLYVFYPVASVFFLRTLALAYVMILYILLCSVFLWLRQREEKEQEEREMACQEAVLLSATKEEKANAAKSDFLRKLSYDIRTPINGIRELVELGNRYDHDLEKQRECRKKIWETSDVLLDLISDMVDMDKLESGAVDLELRSFDMRELYEDVCQWAKELAADRGIRYHSRQLSGKNWKLYGSPSHLKQILKNVVGNAIKDNRGGDCVELSCEERQSAGGTAWFEFVCTDTRSSYRRGEPGLAVAKGLIQMMGGEIHFSDEETGEAFCRIRLPSLIDEEQAQEKDAKVQEAVKRPVSIRGKKILLVEDNELNMEIAEFLLRKEGAQVIRAWNGKEALECFEASAPGDISVILMDLVMPVMDGFQSAKAIRSLEREDASKVAIIALTASDYEEDAQKCRQAGMDEHLPKPLEMRSSRKFQFSVEVHFSHNGSSATCFTVYSCLIRYYCQVYPLIDCSKPECRFHQVIKAHSIGHTHIITAIIIAVHTPTFPFMIISFIICKGGNQIEESFHVFQFHPELNSKCLFASLTESGILRMNTKINVTAILSVNLQFCRN